MTFTLDQATVDSLRRISARLDKPQSYVIREAIVHYEPYAGHLNDTERKKRLAVFDRMLAAVPERPLAEVKSELRAVRDSRRKGWSRAGRRRR